MSQDILIFDRNVLAQKRSNIANSLSKADFLIKRSFEDILERLSEITRDFPSILNLGCRNSYGSNVLAQRYGTKKVVETEFYSGFSDGGAIKIITDEEQLPFANNQFDLIVSVLNFHSVNDLPGCLIQLKNILKPNGVLIASMFGEINLPELRETLFKTELEHLGGISPRVMPCVELKQLGALLQRAGFTSPVVDKDHIEVHYSHPLELLHDLRNMGETNIMINKNKKYLGKEFWRKFSENYIKDFSNSDEEVIASFEILTMLAVK